MKRAFRELGLSGGFLIILSLVIILAGLYILLHFTWIVTDHFDLAGKEDKIAMAETGQIGDFIGGFVGTIWALASVLLLIFTFQQQRKQTKANNRTTALQQFESTFFNLISIHHQLVSSIKEKYHFDKDENEKFEVSIVEGRELFKKVAHIIKETYLNKGFSENIVRATKIMYVLGDIDKTSHNSNLENKFHQMNDGEEKITAVFRHFYSVYRSAFSHYFRNLYHTFKYVDEYNGFNGLYSEKEIEDLKWRYIKILRAQLSSYELVLLWYNGLMGFGEKFGNLMIRRHLLDNIDFHAELIEPEILVSRHLYLKEAYEDQLGKKYGEK